MQIEDRETEIAVVGMSCRFPGARDVAEFWKNLCGGVESVSFFSEDALREAGVAPGLLRDPAFVGAYGALDDPYAFDAAFFGVNPREAPVLDPQHRVFLECAWHALEDAGVDPARFAGAVGVYAGSGFSTHLTRVMQDGELAPMVPWEMVVFGNDKDFLPTRTSYKLGLRGPSVAVQTACSTSLVAIHLACQALLSRECDLALAGGSTVWPDQVGGYLYQEGGIASRDGHCRAFDARAAGTVFGSGAGVVALKRMVDALRDGDTIHAVVKGSAINNDGAGKVGFTAPSVQGQARAVAEAIALAGLDPSDVSYVETHGTGTPLGDPIEVEALREVFGAGAERRAPCALGAVKTNVGHLDTAAGVAGFIKTVLALKHRTLPPTLHFQEPNPETGLEGSPFVVIAELRPWDGGGAPRRAGVSSFGIGGTNAHVVLEEAPVLPGPAGETGGTRAQVLPVSARSRAALDRVRTALAAHLADHPGVPLEDVAYTLQEGRAAHPFRAAAVARDAEGARAALLEGAGAGPREAGRAPSVAFLFPGQGAQYAGMGRELYAEEPVFRAEVDRCAEVLAPELGMDLRAVLFPPEGGEEEAAALLRETRLTQPALFVTGYALARVWESWGVRPRAMLGHSIGEYVAACLAGVFSPEAALRLVAARGRLMQALPAGAMLAVPLPEEELLPLLPDTLSLAAVNGAAHCVVSGSAAEVEALERLLAGRDVSARRLHTSHAFHSAAMDPVLRAFADEVRRARPAAPSLPFLSNVTGDWIAPEEAADPEYWVRHLRRTVRFADGLGRLLEDPDLVLLELGPGETLGTFARRHPGAAGRLVARSLARPGEPHPADVSLREAAAALWTAGVDLDWAALRGPGAPRRVPLPSYPFERTVYQARAAAAREPSHPQTETPVATDTMQTPGRLSRMTDRVAELFARLLGTDAAALDRDGSFLELGADSLLLMQASRTLESTFGVRIAFRQLLEGLSTIPDLAAHLDEVLPAGFVLPGEEPPAPPAPPAAAAPVLAPARPAAAPAAEGGALPEIFAQQLAIMQRQLELLGGSGTVPAAAGNGAPATNGHRAPAAENGPAAPSAEKAPAAHGPHRPVRATREQGGGFDARQAAHFEALVRRYTARTRGSREYASRHRPHLADNRAALGFRQATKELLYPIVGTRSEGARVWDVDGNEYVDFTLGFGVHFFGHRPPFVVRAVEEQLRNGFHTGPQSDLAGPAAELFCEVTGMERVTFCNTGSEAVMTALRVARAVTGRERVVIFEGSYHGCFDGILARPGQAGGAAPRSRPIAPGTPQGMVDDVVVLPYGTPETLEWLRAHADELAAVLVEPVQSNHPELQPRQFLREVRALTEASGAALVFDEVITGLRLGARGAQGLYGIEADLATYGKVIGGGLPVGVLAGRARFMDAIDGGQWSFGDDSFPAADQTFFAGTFCKHPAVMAAAHAVLTHLKEQGPALFEGLNARTSRLVASLRAVLDEAGAPISIVHAHSYFRFVFRPQDPFADLLFYHMLERGIYVWEGRGCFLSTAHTDADCEAMVRALRESLADLREGGFLPGGPGGGISAAGPRAVPLTPAQRQVWVHCQFGDDASRAYNEQFLVGLRTRPDPLALRAAVADLVAHHESLRTVFDPSGEVQHVLPALPGPVPVFVEEPAPGADAGSPRLAEAMGQAVSRVFDLAAGPLFRVHVHANGPERCVLQLVVHHIAADGMSLDILGRDLETAYLARSRGQEPRLPRAMQISEYARLFAEHASTYAAHEDAWLARFEGAPPTALPFDRPRPAFPTHRAGYTAWTLPRDLMDRAREVGERHGSTPFMTLVSGLLAMLHRVTGQDDLVLGISSAGRPFEGAETLVGHCVDVLPVRSRTAPGAGMLRFLRDVRGWLLDAYEHEVFAYGLLHEKRRAPRDAAAAPLISVEINMEPVARDAAEGTPRFADLEMDVVERVGSPFTRWDIHIDAVDRGEEVVLHCTFNADLLERATVERMMAQVQRVLEQVVRDGDVPLDRLELLDEAERRQLVDEWNRTGTAYDAGSCVHRLFEAQAARTPDAVALVCEERSLTYRELNEQANRLAHHLRALGVAPDTRVGMLFERGAEMVAGLLGVLKAGGAYVALDTALPAERLAFMLSDSGAAALVTLRGLAGRLPAGEVPVVCLDDSPSLVQHPSHDPEGGAGPADLAYVVYTSGSTGQPKGVAVEHRNLANYLFGLRERLGLEPGAAYATVSTLSADLGNTVVFSALAWGGTLHVLAEQRIFSGDAVAEYFARHAVDCLKITPSHLAALQAGGDPARVMPRRWLVLGGEASPLEWVDELLRAAPECAVFNHYGPTEATVGALTFRATPERPETQSQTLVLGRPLPNCQVFVVDADLRPVPVGVAGELLIGGAGVARGYLGRPELSAERFVQSPFGEGRLYRTGDRCRMLADGNVEFLGRLDDQVKIRGFRVEPGEVEIALRSHPGVREGAVIARREPESGETQLVAYVAGDAGAPALREHLGRTLPEYMVPAVFVPVEGIPLTPNGKLDRAALPAPESAPQEKAFVAPRTPVEEVLAGIFADVLKVERLSIHDGFFELGGHSLRAARVGARARAVFGVDLKPRDLFEAQTVAQLAERVEAIRRKQAGLLPPVTRTGRAGPLRLSFAQERLWFLDRLQPGSAAYNRALGLRLSGALDVPALERALAELVRRHEVLRTVLREQDGVPVQVILPAEGFSLPVADLSTLEGGARDEEVARRVSDEAQRPFDLAEGPLFRAGLLRLAPEEHVLTLTLHHVVSDGWSLGVLFGELAATYGAFREGKEASLPELPVQYADFAAWQREHVAGEVLDRQLAWWKARLAGAPAVMELPTDHPRPPRPLHRGAQEHAALAAELRERLHALARKEGATLYMVLLGAFQVLLSRYAGSEDVVVGSPIAGRSTPEVEGLIGFFVNTLALRTDLSGDPTFRDVLRRVRDVTLGAYENQEAPFERLVEELQPERSLARSPLFQVMFTMANAVESLDLELPGLRVEDVTRGTGAVKFDLTLHCAEVGAELWATLGYSSELFERATAVRMLGHLQRVLERVAAAPDARLSDLDLMGEAERARVVEEWNDTGPGEPGEGCVHALFEAQARRTPDAVALTSGGEPLTYAALNARANRLAHHLRALGVGHEARVALCAERGPEMVVALLAVLKAGGAYLPLDPAYPAERLRRMVEDGAPALLLAHGASDALVRAVAGDDLAVVRLEADEAWAGLPDTDPAPNGVGPESLAYVIYTSGSTGTPKGVMNHHGSVSNRVAWGLAAWALGPDDAVLCKTSLGFDGHVREIFLPLAAGARVVVAPPGAHRDPDLLLEVIRAEGITTVNLVPSLLQVLLEHPRLSRAAGLARVLCGGEALPGSVLRRFRERLPGTALHNLYGPSEAATATAALACGPGQARATVPIGRPIAHTRVYVLDRRGRPAPAGVPGELYVGGAGVARGYLGRPGMTAERFVPDPFAGAPGARLYRTGDLARWLGDGSVEFLGRTDDQIKVRGFRVEPAEVEAALREHPGVREAVVLPRRDATGEVRLVAWHAGADDADAHALRAHLSERLPEHMVPAAYVRLEALPLTPSGKLDRAALPEPGGDAFATRPWEAPEGQAEEAVARVWAEVLGLERVGRWDHFFELGGHSLRAVQVVSRVRQALGVEAPLADLFARPVLADFARGLEGAARSVLPPVRPVPRDAPLPLSFAQQRLWFLERMGAVGSAYHVPVRLRMRGELHGGALEQALNAIVARHEALRTTFGQEGDGQPVQRIVPAAEAPLALASHDLAGQPDAEDELRRIMADEAGAPFDLERGPVLRGRLVRMAEDDHVLLLTVHHLAWDGWSLGVMVDELRVLYAALREGRPDPLAPLPVQYADYAAWERRWLEGEALRAQSDYWRGALAGAPERLELPADRPRPAQQDFAGGRVDLALDATLTAGLKELSRRHGTTLFTPVLAGWAALLSRLSGQDDVVVGTPAAHRGRRELEGLIGFFVNTLALRVDLSGSPTVAELLARVKDRSVQAQQNQDVPFERVVELVQPVRSLAHSPLFQVALAWGNAPGGDLELAGLALEGVEGAPQLAAKYDLSLWMHEHEGRLVGGLTYAAALFDAATVERWAGYLRTMLEAFVADDARRVDRLPILPEEERLRVLDEWNRTGRDYPSDVCLHELFARRAAERPADVALEWEGESLTYAELDARANRLAHHLAELGVGPESRVGVLLERGVDLVVSVLAIVKAGGCYVPLDPAYPAERLRLMLADAGAAVLVTRAGPGAAVGADGVRVVALDAAAAAIEAQPAEAPASGATAGNLAYIVYTSGSTGRPKGVMVNHRTVVQLVVETDYVCFAPGDRIAQASNASFDALAFEVWGALLNGATLVGVPRDVLLSPAAMRAHLREHRITTLYQTTALLNQLSREQPDLFGSLRELLFGGQQVDADAVRRLLRHGRPQRLLHMYGPTETTAWCSCHPVEEVAGDARTVSVGRPTGNQRIYLLDAAMEPVPVGVPGEAYVGGGGVVRGYLDRPALTAERFVPDPFSPEPGARMYRTGDKLRRGPDGALEFVGRLDDQVKIRGFRIEPGEVEAALGAYPGVQEARVVVREDQPGEPRLVAYVVGGADPEALRGFLAGSLPEYMLPAAFVEVERLPLTPSGKLDHAALPAPDYAGAEEGHVAPRTAAEQALAAIWAEVLGVDRVGVHDDFFRLGGHSLLVMRLVARVQDAFGAALPIRAVFAAPALGAMAAEVEKRVIEDVIALSDEQAEALHDVNLIAGD